MYIYKISKNYFSPNESCQKGKKQATKFHISTTNLRQKLLQVLAKN